MANHKTTTSAPVQTTLATPNASTGNVYDLSHALSPDATISLLLLALILASAGLLLVQKRVVHVALRRVWGYER